MSLYKRARRCHRNKRQLSSYYRLTLIELFYEMTPRGRILASKGKQFHCKQAIWLFLPKCVLMPTDALSEDLRPKAAARRPTLTPNKVLQVNCATNRCSSCHSLHVVFSQFGPVPSWYNYQLTNDHTQRSQ